MLLMHKNNKRSDVFKFKLSKLVRCDKACVGLFVRGRRSNVRNG